MENGKWLFPTFHGETLGLAQVPYLNGARIGARNGARIGARIGVRNGCESAGRETSGSMKNEK